MIGQLFSRVYYCLELPVEGTDDKVAHFELRRAYFSIVLSILNAGNQDIFLSERAFAVLRHAEMSLMSDALRQAISQTSRIS